MMELITELFDEDTTLPITNLNPKKKAVPHPVQQKVQNPKFSMMQRQ